MSKVSQEEQRIVADIVNTSVAHHHVFAVATSVNSDNAKRWQSAARTSALLSESLKGLRLQTADLVTRGHQWKNDKAVAVAAVQNHHKVVELLDAPQTLDVCLRNEMFHEALLVLDHVRNVVAEQRERGAVRLFANLEANMELALRTALQTSVLPRLSQPMPLNTAVRLITFLRRLRTPEDALLRLFVSKKSEFIDGLIQEADGLSHTPYSFLSKLLTVFKVHVTEAVTQTTACFPQQLVADELMLWCGVQTSQLLGLFQSRLRLITNGSEVASLMEQATNCSTAACKVGLDVSFLLSEALSKRTLELFVAQIAGSTSTFRAAIASFSWKVPLHASGSGGDSGAAATAGPPPPPSSILSFLPLAYAMNGILSAFNEIRKCAARCVAVACCDELAAFLEIIACEIRRTARSASLMEPQEQHAFQVYCSVFSDDFVPHVLLAAENIFGKSSAALASLKKHTSRALQAIVKEGVEP